MPPLTPSSTSIRRAALPGAWSRALGLPDDRDAGRQSPLDLGLQRAVAMPGVDDVLEEAVVADLVLERLRVEEVVVDAVALAGAARPRGGGHGHLESWETGKDGVDQ